MTIIWCMIPEIWSATDIIFCHSGPFFALLPPLWTQKIKTLQKLTTHLKILSLYKCVPQMTIIWCMVPEIWSVTDRIFCHFGLFFAFLPLPPPNNLKNLNFEKLKKAPGDIILHLCTINNNHMMYGSWDMKCDGQNFLSFGTVSCHFNPDKLKKSLEILSFYTCVP